ncbi:asparagine synthase-related protein [Nocardia sp. NPDC127579]|uniref:asparagine synthase-related protein n=1 Tax=Nocardia sp. NPDC127579 TaxID=3345402 RepID=UPI00363EB422
MTNPITSKQTSEPWQQIADLRDIATLRPGLRQLTDPHHAAELLRAEMRDRLEAVLKAFPHEPVILLSGGVDSIAVAAAAVELGAHPHAITVVTSEGTDAANATVAAQALGLTHEVIELDTQAVGDLARESVTRLGTSELWEVSYAVPLLAVANSLDKRGPVGPLLTGSAADAILAGGKTLHQPIETAAAVEELDQIIRKESAHNFQYERLVPDFQHRILPQYEDRFIHLFQTLRFWELTETFAPPALFGELGGSSVDKLCLRIACEQLLPETAKSLATAKKSPIQRSAGIMGALMDAARQAAADLPGAQTYTNPLTESPDAVATRLYLASLSN